MNFLRLPLKATGHKQMARFLIMTILVSIAALVAFQPAYAQPTAPETKSDLAVWVGIWEIPGGEAPAANAATKNAAVEIKMSADGKGLEISRKAENQPEVKEIIIPDGVRRPTNADKCTGWQSSQMIPGTGSILSSSEMKCEGKDVVSSSDLRILTSPDEMVDILSISFKGQAGIATKRMVYRNDVPSSGSAPAAWTSAMARTAASAPWKMESIIQLSRILDSKVMQAALMEKDAQIEINSKTLKEMKKGKVPQEIVDLLVALAYPDQFHIEKNGAVELKSWGSASSSIGGSVPADLKNTNSRDALHSLQQMRNPNNSLSSYDYMSYLPFDYQGFGPIFGYYSSDFGYSDFYYYSSPIWSGRYYMSHVPQTVTVQQVQPHTGRLSAGQGYISISPLNGGSVVTGAQQRNYSKSGSGSTLVSPSYSSGSSSGSSSNSGSSGGYSSGSGSSSGGSSAPSASPSGYSSGGR